MFARMFTLQPIEKEAIRINIENLKISIYGECELTNAYLVNRDAYQRKQLLNMPIKHIQDRMSSLTDYISTFKKTILDDVIAYKELNSTAVMPKSMTENLKTLDVLAEFEKEIQKLKLVLRQMKRNGEFIYDEPEQQPTELSSTHSQRGFWF